MDLDKVLDKVQDDVKTMSPDDALIILALSGAEEKWGKTVRGTHEQVFNLLINWAMADPNAAMILTDVADFINHTPKSKEPKASVLPIKPSKIPS